MRRELRLFAVGVWKYWVWMIGSVVVAFVQVVLLAFRVGIPPMFALLTLGLGLFSACFLAWRDEYLRNRDSESSIGLRLTVLHFDYDGEAKNLEARLLFTNTGLEQRTVLGVSFLYRKSASDQQFDFFPSGPHDIPFIGHLDPIKVSPQTEEIKTYRAQIEAERFGVVGSQAGLNITFSVSEGRTDSASVIALEFVDSGLFTPSRRFPLIENLALDQISQSKKVATMIRKARAESAEKALLDPPKSLPGLFDY